MDGWTKGSEGRKNERKRKQAGKERRTDGRKQRKKERKEASKDGRKEAKEERAKGSKEAKSTCFSRRRFWS
jgi:hypothetical protein